MLEKRIEKKLRDDVKNIGGAVFKFTSPGANGVPDRIVLYKSKCYFVELKAPGKNLRPTQRAVSKVLNKQGFTVYVIDSLDKVGDFIHGIQST